jgi:CRISPR-associated endonuclease/helicase Cas3
VDFWAHQNQPLVDHLKDVGELAAGFAVAFDAKEYARLAGLLHDLGKAENEFQKRIMSNDKKGEKEPHAHHGAALAIKRQAWPIAFAVNGHHAGLHDRSKVDQIRIGYLPKAEACLRKLCERHPEWSSPEITEALPQWIKTLPFDARRTAEGWFATDVFTRFLFSALVDADSLNTEQHAQGDDASVAARKWPTFGPSQWLEILRHELARRAAKANEDGTASPEVQSVWSEVGAECEKAAKEPPGLFSLTVPTGGGKTLASMLFALAHAAHHNADTGKKPFRRIIVVIPYLSIIHQTVRALREVFEDKIGHSIVLEHHSQAEDHEAKVYTKEKHDGAIDEAARRRRLAAENWDAPIIVTTSVQFFSSLFSRRRSAARKLHNLCQSIVIFDEVQTLPPLLMQPILSVLGELTHEHRPYGCSIVFCTATQPALGKSESLPCGLTSVRPIVPEDAVRRHFKELERVNYEWPTDGETLSWDELAGRIVGDRRRTDQQVLAIVNTRQAARDLHAAIETKLRAQSQGDPTAPIDGLFHLSTWMIPSHRDDVLMEVERRLAPKLEPNDEPKQRCILVSTQCIEAGVDVDFPEAWRAFGPFDSIVQAAGRCNRRGLRPMKGVVHVFRPAEPGIPRGLYHTATSQTDLLRRIGRADPHDPESFTDYFRLLYQLSVPDECLIQKERAKLHFEQVDELFKFIDDNTFPVLVLNQRFTGAPVDSPTPAAEIYEAAKRRGFFVREDWRQFQPYFINLLIGSRNRPPFQENLRQCEFDPDCGLYVWTGLYRGGLDGFGISFEGLAVEDSVI